MYRLFEKIPFLKNRLTGKSLVNILMVTLALILIILDISPGRIFCFEALIFSALGDAVLELGFPSRKKNKNRDYIIAGALLSLSHIVFVYAYGAQIKENQYDYYNNGVIFAVLIMVAVTIFILITAKKPSIMIALASVYMIIFGLEFLTIASYAYSAKSIASLSVVGAMMLLASNVMFELELFSGLESKTARELVWWLYPIGQIIIIIFA